MTKMFEKDPRESDPMFKETHGITNIYYGGGLAEYVMSAWNETEQLNFVNGKYHPALIKHTITYKDFIEVKTILFKDEGSRLQYYLLNRDEFPNYQVSDLFNVFCN